MMTSSPEYTRLFKIVKHAILMGRQETGAHDDLDVLAHHITSEVAINCSLKPIAPSKPSGRRAPSEKTTAIPN